MTGPMFPSGWAAGPARPPALRPPVDGECQFCGGQPAVRTVFQSVASVLIFYVISSNPGWMCRSCGLAMFRHHGTRSLRWSWWGVGVFGMPILLLANRLRLRRVLRLAAPQPSAGVAARFPAPLDAGKPLLARPSGIVGVVVLSALVFLVMVGIATA